VARGSRILVVGEAPAASGWWVTGRAFYRRTPDGALSLSRTGANLNECLAALNANLESVGFVEAVRCRPSSSASWRPSDRVRRKCLPFLAEHFRLTQPLFILPIGQVAAASCLEIAFGTAPAKLEDVVGKAASWQSPWGQAWVLPLYHPSPASNSRWPQNKEFLASFATEHPMAHQTAAR
jgi:uracil-DNA glycosylase family 4